MKYIFKINIKIKMHDIFKWFIIKLEAIIKRYLTHFI